MKAESLYDLVKTLSKSEKRYLKLFSTFSSGRNDSATIRLFNALDAMEFFDGAALEKRWGGKAGQLPVLQTRLFELILRSLRLMRSNENLDWQLGEIVADVEILFERNLFPECLRKIAKGKKLCQKHGKYDFLLQILRWEYKVHLISSRSGLLEDMNLAQQERLAAGQKLNELNRAEVAEGMSRVLLRSAGQGKLPEWQKEFQDHLASFEENAPHPDSNFQAWLFWIRACGNSAYLKGEYFEASQLFGKILKSLETRPFWLDHYPAEYLSVFNNFLSCCLLSDQPDEFRRQIAISRQIPSPRADIRVQFEFQAHIRELQFSLNYHSHGESMAMLDSFSEWLDKNENEVPVSKLLAAYFNAFSLHFVNGEFRKANEWLLKILSTPGREERRDVRDVARIFQVILHHELGNPDLQDYLLESSYRYFRRNDRLGKMDSALIRFFRAEQKFPPETLAFRNALEELDRETQDVIRTGKGKIPLGMTEVSFWVKSKLEGVPLREYYEKMVAGQRKGS